VIIHAGTILGADAFTTKTRWRIWPITFWWKSCYQR
jgi:hypothetical protein